jgi:hypothetical protein
MSDPSELVGLPTSQSKLTVAPFAALRAARECGRRIPEPEVRPIAGIRAVRTPLGPSEDRAHHLPGENRLLGRRCRGRGYHSH